MKTEIIIKKNNEMCFVFTDPVLNTYKFKGSCSGALNQLLCNKLSAMLLRYVSDDWYGFNSLWMTVLPDDLNIQIMGLKPCIQGIKLIEYKVSRDKTHQIYYCSPFLDMLFKHKKINVNMVKKYSFDSENYYCGKDKKEIDDIYNPFYYKNGSHESIDIMRSLYGDEAVRGFCKCNSYKYRYRAGKKTSDPTEDIKKAEWYEDYLFKMNKEQRNEAF